jgi:N4-(beta-N-acetylglucosaminyl)-L-asparaginase
LYVDNEIGAATATGHGEEVIRCGLSFGCRIDASGKSPQKHVKKLLTEIIKLTKNRNKN